jgi:predicted TIM-barrel fold metal-dependent hydrolase
MGFVDCDSHVIETESTWDYLDPSERVYRPRVFTAQYTEGPGVAPPSFWIAGDSWTRRPTGEFNLYGNANAYTPGATELDDLAAREEDLDALGIDAQLLVPTFWLGIEMDHPLAEAALCRSYNRWVAERVHGRECRFPWAMRAPLRLLDRAFDELEFGKAHGAVGIQLKGVEHGYFLSDPMFYPLFERAQELDMAIIVHLGTAARRVDNLPPGKLIWSPPALMEHVHKVMAGLHAVISSDLPERFPRLRWGFLEAGASWAPAVLQQHARLVASGGEFLRMHRLTGEELAARNVYITCQTDEDIDYLTTVLGDDVLCLGTDYGHNDLGSELAAHQHLLRRADVPAGAARRIVDDNGRRFLGVDEAYRPAPDVVETTTLPRTKRADGSAAILTGITY